MESEVVRVRFTLSGVVQGVGLRPAICRLARGLTLTGFVRNHGAAVILEVQGGWNSIQAFQKELKSGFGQPARIESVDCQSVDLCSESGFEIASSDESLHSGLIAPDAAVCADCVRDILDPDRRRHGYPFATCSTCGPRYTIVRHPPFDRPNTSMSSFAMCSTCRTEYQDEADRRVHAQTISCSECGPKLVLEDGTNSLGFGAVGTALRLLRDGSILAIKGVGGFHLACDALNNDAVATLRRRKERGSKPFAMMAADVKRVRQYASVGPSEEEMLRGPERPIVLLRRRSDSRIAGQVAPGAQDVGFMLPPTPLHQLLAGDRPLVLTSANLSNEPIIWKNDDARRRLVGIADAMLLHDRDILAPCEDSVVRCVAGRLQSVRRSRGYVPLPIRVPAARSVLAVGGDLKGTICLAASGYAFLGPHMGDMESPAALTLLEETVERFQSLFRIVPEAVACDAHPGYHTARWAEEYARSRGVPLVRVQHHRAHVASLLAENARTEPIIGVCFDGTGFGDDGTVWGGELFATERAAHLIPVLLPGGDATVEKPYRMALSWLHAAGIEWCDDLPCFQMCPPAERHVLKRQIELRLNCVPTSSIGRLFDAVSALIGVCGHATYEGQAAIELETVCDHAEWSSYEFAIQSGTPLVLDARPVIRQIVEDVRQSVPRAVIATRFHRGLARVVGDVCCQIRERTGLATVGLTGGVFQSTTLTTLLLEALPKDGFEVLIHRQVPTNDGGLSLGQAVLAGMA